jgi:hypothetical protein
MTDAEMNSVYKEWLSDRPYYKTLRKWNPHLPEIIIERHPKKTDDPAGFVSRVVTGPPGAGKSMYAYLIGAKTFWLYDGCSRDEDTEACFKQSLDCIIYRPDDLFKMVKEQRKRAEPMLLLIVDDASVHQGRALFDQDRKTYRRLQGTIPTLREDCTGLLLTTPKTILLCKPWREFIDYKCEVRSLSAYKENRRMASHYYRRYFPDDVKFRMQLPFREKFSSLCPLPFYDWYLEKKRKALNEYQALCDKLILDPVDNSEEPEEDNNE